MAGNSRLSFAYFRRCKRCDHKASHIKGRCFECGSDCSEKPKPRQQKPQRIPFTITKKDHE